MVSSGTILYPQGMLQDVVSLNEPGMMVCLILYVWSCWICWIRLLFGDSQSIFSMFFFLMGAIDFDTFLSPQPNDHYWSHWHRRWWTHILLSACWMHKRDAYWPTSCIMRVPMAARTWEEYPQSQHSTDWKFRRSRSPTVFVPHGKDVRDSWILLVWLDWQWWAIITAHDQKLGQSKPEQNISISFQVLWLVV